MDSRAEEMGQVVDIADRSFMQRFCASGRIGLDKPWSVDGFDCATNGHVLLMVPGATFPSLENTPDLSKTLAIKLTESASVPFRALCHWAQIAGSLLGFCSSCGDLNTKAQVTVGSLCGRFVNRRLLGHHLCDLGAETVRIHVGETLDPICIECPDWRLYIMPLKLADGDSYEFPAKTGGVLA